MKGDEIRDEEGQRKVMKEATFSLVEVHDLLIHQIRSRNCPN